MVNDDEDDAMAHCCAECGEEGGVVSLKACMSCKSVKYCNAKCQRNHWPTHKKKCKQRAAELRDEALFKDPPPKEDCPICFLPMPMNIICCISLPPATISSVPINDFADAHQELAVKGMGEYYPCCGKRICRGCAHSFRQSGNMKCPFCNSDRGNKLGEDCVEEITERAKANDAASICALARYYNDGVGGVQPDQTKAIELYGRAANLGNKEAHCHLAYIYHEGGDFKKAKFHYVAAAMAGHELARSNLGSIEGQSDIERALKHLSIAASAGEYGAMYSLILFFKKGVISRESINSTLAAYNNSCVEMRSEARDACIQFALETV